MGMRLPPELERKVLAAALPGRPSPPPEPESEKDFQAAVVRRAKELGWSLVYHTRDSRRSPKGFPDLVLVKPGAADSQGNPLPGTGAVVFAELKAEGGTPTAEQLDWLFGLRTASVRAYLWRPGDWAAIEAALAERGAAPAGLVGRKAEVQG